VTLVDLFPRFDMTVVLSRVENNEYSIFMAVPAIYVKLIQYLESLKQEQQVAICRGFKAMCLNVSDSAACPVKVYEQWLQLTG